MSDLNKPMPTFGAIIIGDEILSGKRVDKHFSWLTGVMAARGLRLSWVEYLGDDRARLAEVFARTRAAGDVVFSFGGIGTTPDRLAAMTNCSHTGCTHWPTKSSVSTA